MKLPVSSREKPNVICVKSLVPNEKNSACSAILSASSAAMPHHRVRLVEGLRTLTEHLEIDAELVGQLRELLFRLRHELVKRRIEEADRDRQTVHDLEGLADVLLDVDEEVVERRAALLL